MFNILDDVLVFGVLGHVCPIVGHQQWLRNPGKGARFGAAVVIDVNVINASGETIYRQVSLHVGVDLSGQVGLRDDQLFRPRAFVTKMT